jgi:hypothetical protein
MISANHVLYPAKPGDWVAPKWGLTHVGKIKSIYLDPALKSAPDAESAFLIDLVLYAFNGDRIGRKSAACGGPKHFEPACAWNDYRRINPPKFPLELHWIEKRSGQKVAEYNLGPHLEDRAWAPPAKRNAVAPRSVSPLGNQINIEIAGLRMAAEIIRDTMRAINIPEAVASLSSRLQEIEGQISALNSPLP